MARHIYNTYVSKQHPQQGEDINSEPEEASAAYPNSPFQAYARRSYQTPTEPTPAPSNPAPAATSRPNSNSIYQTHLEVIPSNHLDTTNTTYVETSMDMYTQQPPKKVRKNKEKKPEDIKNPNHSNSQSILSQTNLEKSAGTDLETQGLKNEDRLFSFLFSKKVPPITAEEDRKLYPWKASWGFSRLCFWWLWPVLKKGYKRTLLASDLWVLTPELTVEHLHAKFDTYLQSILRKAEQKHLKNHPDLLKFEWPTLAIPKALLYTFGWQYILSCVFLALSFCCQALSPLLTRRLIDFVEYRYFGIEKTLNKGIGYTLGSVVLIFINGLLLNHFFHSAMVSGAQAKSILTKALLLKSFHLNAKSRYLFPHGRITSLMSTDLARIDLAIGFQPLVVCFPIPVIIAICLLTTSIGVPALAGIGLFLVSLVVCVLLTGKLFMTRENVVKHTDQRISLMREVLNNMKVIKFYAWEMAYRASITKVRSTEMKYLFTIKVLRNFITAYAVTLPTLTSMVSFVTMFYTGKMKSPGAVFSSLSLFSILAQAIMLLPIALATGADAYVGFNRCNSYLSAEEYDESVDTKLSGSNQYFIGTDLANSLSGEESDSNVIEVRHADFVWESYHDELDSTLWDLSDDAKKERKQRKKEEKEKNKLRMRELQAASGKREGETSSRISNDTYFSNSSDSSSAQAQFPGLIDVNLSIKKEEFVIITGVIGSGKSSLLSALAGFMKLNNPERAKLHIKEDLLLCATPWIQNATVRANILFGKPYEPAHYRRVLHACALEEDIAILPAGDHTEIGERGITLSGGQKARINLARACYSHAEIFLFDDVISAVDARVGRHIVNNLFKGLLKGKTIVLATHQLGILEAADKVVFLNGDGSIDVGTVPELLARNEIFQRLVEYTRETNNLEDEEDSENEKSHEIELNLIRKQSVLEVEDNGLGKTTIVEELATNAISWAIYKKYIHLGSGIFGYLAAPVFLLLVSLGTFCQLFTNTWLTFWTEKKFKGRDDNFYVTYYVLFACLTVVFTAIEFTMLAYMNNVSAELLNVKAVEKILHAPMSLLDTTPIGRILNRFTKDTDSLDNEIGEQLRLFIFPLATIIGIIILCICYLPWFALAVPFLGFGFLVLSNFYQGSSREIKRLEATQRSLVYNNFNETLAGMNTIQAFCAEDEFIKKNDKYLNNMNEAYYLSIATQRWLCVQLDVIASIFALIICLMCICEVFEISASATGLLLNYVIQIVGLLSLTVRAMTLVENEMNSVERLHEYSFHLPQEAAYTKSEFTPPQEWPSSGYIEFKDVSLRYRANLPTVLKDMNLSVYPGEKVGICGRTGAGKSSIMTALYRLTELEKGSIEIDGLDISNMRLYDLRSKLSIIPQDPVLFQGTVRKNLDPFGNYNDDLLWDTLRRTGLIDDMLLKRVMNTKYDPKNDVTYENLHKFHLDQIVDDDGSNFSLGERQLIALARSMVRNSKILILDEATSSVDFETDSMIQETITNEFSSCTILCIAHRLKTILKYDRIIVMDQGRIVEKGAPWALYNSGGPFRKMCDKANLSSEDFE
jgi:ATP-binding cassette subfamily C (CFTR/MRP) protein 1